MKKKELIKQLEKYSDEIEVCIFDWKYNLSQDEGDGSAAGIYSEFIVESPDFDTKERFLFLSFENEES